MRVQQEKDCIKQDAFLPFLSHTCLQKAISHKYEILWADFAGLFALGHLKIKFSKEHFVFLDRGSLKPFLCMRGCFPLIQWGSRNLCLRNLGHNSERSKQTSQSPVHANILPGRRLYDSSSGAQGALNKQSTLQDTGKQPRASHAL